MKHYIYKVNFIFISSGSFYFSGITKTLKSENWQCLKDYDDYIINCLRMSHTLKRNLKAHFKVWDSFWQLKAL